MRQFFQPCFWRFLIFHPQSIVRNKPNLDCFQHMYGRSDAENFSSVCLVVCEIYNSNSKSVNICKYKVREYWLLL